MATWTYGPESFANSDVADAAFRAARQAGTIPAEAAQVFGKLATAYSSTTGPAFTVSGSGETGVDGSYTVSVP